jgi:DNA invertase Pin-like site-specific DNA recombinase
MAELGYARVSTRAQDLERQRHALRGAGITDEHMWTDKHTSATMNRPAWQELCRYAREGDRITVHTLDRLGGNMREMLNAIEDLRRRGISVRTLADPITVDTSDQSPMGQLALNMLLMFGQMRRTYIAEQAAHARQVAAEQGRQTGRPRKLDGATLDAARAAVNEGMAIKDAATVFGLSTATAYRYLGPATRTVERDQNRSA